MPLWDVCDQVRREGRIFHLSYEGQMPTVKLNHVLLPFNVELIPNLSILENVRVSYDGEIELIRGIRRSIFLLEEGTEHNLMPGFDLINLNVLQSDSPNSLCVIPLDFTTSASRDEIEMMLRLFKSQGSTRIDLKRLDERGLATALKLYSSGLLRGILISEPENDHVLNLLSEEKPLVDSLIDEVRSAVLIRKFLSPDGRVFHNLEMRMSYQDLRGLLSDLESLRAYISYLFYA